MKNRNILPPLATPVKRITVAATENQADGVVALSYCDIVTMECFPFADDSAD